MRTLIDCSADLIGDHRLKEDSFRPTLVPFFIGKARHNLETLERHKGLDPSGNQKRLLVWAKEHGGAFTSSNYQGLVGVDIYRASRDIKDLMPKGLVRHEARRSRIYRLMEEKEALLLPEELKKILPLLRKQGYVKNADLVKEWNVDRRLATYKAKKLVEEGWLQLEGRGRGACYVITQALRERLNEHIQK